MKSSWVRNISVQGTFLCTKYKVGVNGNGEGVGRDGRGERESSKYNNGTSGYDFRIG